MPLPLNCIWLNWHLADAIALPNWHLSITPIDVAAIKFAVYDFAVSVFSAIGLTTGADLHADTLAADRLDSAPRFCSKSCALRVR